MARTTSQIQEESEEEFAFVFYLTARQLEILKELTKYTGEKVDKLLADSIEHDLDAVMQTPEMMGSAIRDAWNGESCRRPLEKDGRKKVTVVLKLPTRKVRMLNAIQMLMHDTDPRLYQDCLEDSIRAYFEVLKEKIPEDIRRQLESDWKKEMGYVD